MAANHVTVYRSDDPSAPNLVGIPVSEVPYRLLKACLVDGYPGKPGAGWTMHFVSDDLKKCAVRNETQTGYARFDASVKPQGYPVRVDIFETMTDIESGSNQWSYKESSGSGALINALYFANSNFNSSSFRWWVVASERSCYIFLADHDNLYGNSRCAFFMGEPIVPELRQEALGNFIACCSASSNSQTSYMGQSGFHRHSFLRLPNGDVRQSPVSELFTTHYLNSQNILNVNIPELNLVPVLITGKGPGMGADFSHFGKLPGFFLELYTVKAYGAMYNDVLRAEGKYWGDALQIGGREFLIHQQGSSSRFVSMISTNAEDW
ncbi:hypothetical protein [Parendozoicomonas sp. Alg238-R29]|uniref:hypothetical protein n=1 Tax=Parendozoicomonas sp. Alg238-R29 TaxID=2993446 RepID=UPI00248E1453|nr:hypothetical protein [Parendozoicomonas sp. Alg238-R29]